MAEEGNSLKALYSSAETKRAELEAAINSNTPAYQDKLAAAIATYEKCLRLVDQVALFSDNESVDDLSSNNIQYLLIHYRIADLLQRQTAADRKTALSQAQSSYAQYLKSLDNYDLLSAGDARLFERYRESPNTFSTASTTDPAARRETKISRFREEKEMRQKLDHLRRNPTALQNDDEMYRRLQLAQLAYCTHQAFQSLESIAQEMHILSLAPRDPPPSSNHSDQPRDMRERGGRTDNYSERLDGPLSAGLTGPILSPDGRPLRPFTLLDTRTRMQQGVFRPDHSLPTMTIDEYLDEERRRGGMIEGGGAQSGMSPEPDEDNLEKADAETMKARAWDEYTEDNPKGSGNTVNRG
ncbi:hypothetical protein AAFC00_006927 [Neodothiora populina]|uniref:Type 2A phosphatase-associated protein 42 n=1 Tax=Neodothiora populina TaxID=2781224 RepID=A0ABR3PBM9_9PEZI